MSRAAHQIIKRPLLTEKGTRLRVIELNDHVPSKSGWP